MGVTDVTVSRAGSHQTLQIYGANRSQSPKVNNEPINRASARKVPGADIGVYHAASIYTKGVSVVIGGQMAPQTPLQPHLVASSPRSSDQQDTIGRLIDIKV